MPDYTLSAKITGDSSGYQKAINEADKSTEQFQKNTSSLGSKLAGGLKTGLSVSAKAIAAVSGALGTASVAAIKVGSDFEAQMSRVQAISGATGKELEELRNQAIQLGADTSFSASEAAQGMENLAAAGFTTSEIMDAMPGLLDLAAAAGEDLAASSDIAASTLRGFGLAASDAGHVADVLAENANRTNSSVAETGEAMKYIAPLARAAGISMEETAAAIGIMANAGIQGSQAGTTLRGALSRLSKPTDDMVGVMEQLGISFYDSEGKMKSLSDQVGMLRTAMQGMTDEQKNNVLVTLYGQESLSGMLALINEGEGSLTQLTESFRECDGAAQQAATTMQDNLQGAIEQMKGSLETLGIVLYDSLSEPLKNLAQQATESINQLTTAFQENGMEGLISVGGQIISNILIGIAESLPSLLENAILIIQQIVASLNENMPQLVTAGGQILLTLISGMATLLPTLGEFALNLITQIGNGITENAPQLVPKGIEAVLQFIQGIVSNFPQIVSTGLDMLVSLAEGIANSLPTLIAEVPKIINEFCSNIDSLLPKILSAGIQIIIALGKGIIQSIPTIIANAGEIVTAILNVITHLNLFSTGANLIKGLGNGIKSIFSSISSIIKNLISKIKNPFNINWGSIGENIIKGIAKGISSAIGWVVNAAKKAAQSAFNAAKSLLGIHSPSTLFRDEIGLNMALGMGIGFEDNIPIQDINSALDNAVNKISGHYAEVGQRINPVDAITGTSRVAETYQADVSNIFEGMTIIVDNTTNLDGTPIYKNAARYTISEIGNQQKAVLKARGAFA